MTKIWVKHRGNNIAQVEFNDNLLKADESIPDFDCYSSLGITKLKSGPYVLIHGANDDEDEADSAEIVSDQVAFNAIVNTGNDHMLDEPKYARLKAFMLVDGEDDGTNTTDVFVTKTTVKKQGNSLVLILTDELRLLGLDVGDTVDVIVYKT